MGSTEVDGVTITWFGHASFKVKGEVVVYIDPYVLPEDVEPADIILATHDHYDHCDVGNIDRLKKEDTVIVTTSACGGKLRGDVRTVKAGDSISVKGVEIQAVHSYNISKPFHGKGAGVGFILKLNNVRIYHTGDSDFIPEMKNIEADVALLPIGGTYTMDYRDAAEAAMAIKPRIAIPMHYNYISGTEADPEKFKEMIKDPNIEVRIL
jgi:L-ascorbate metabolism protein UlaG (beta-lactamase superfamily)